MKCKYCKVEFDHPFVVIYEKKRKKLENEKREIKIDTGIFCSDTCLIGYLKRKR